MLECGSTGVLDCRDLRKSLDSMRQNAFDGLPLSPMAQRAYPITPTLHHSSILWDATDLVTRISHRMAERDLSRRERDAGFGI